MALAKKQLREEQTAEFKRELQKRLSEQLKAQPDVNLATWFGRNKESVLEFGRRISEFKGLNEIIRVNDIGLGLRKSKIEIVGVGELKTNIPYEPFELLNQARNAGIEPEKIILYAADIRTDVLLSLKSTKTIKMPAGLEDIEYFRDFFPEFHKKDEKMVSVEIPEEWRKRIVLLKLNILEQPTPVKAHITFSYVPEVESRPECFENLVASTRRGGYVFCGTVIWRDETLKNLNVERIPVTNYRPIFHLE